MSDVQLFLLLPTLVSVSGETESYTHYFNSGGGGACSRDPT